MKKTSTLLMLGSALLCWVPATSFAEAMHFDCSIQCAAGDQNCHLYTEYFHDQLGGCSTEFRPDNAQRCTTTIGTSRRPTRLHEVVCDGQQCRITGALKCLRPGNIPSFPTFDMTCHKSGAGFMPSVKAQEYWVTCDYISSQIRATCSEDGSTVLLEVL